MSFCDLFVGLPLVLSFFYNLKTMLCRGQGQSLLPCITTKIHGSKSTDFKEARLPLAFVFVCVYIW